MKNWTKTVESDLNQELCSDVTRKEIFVQISLCRRQKSGKWPEIDYKITVKRLICCNILRSEIPPGIKVSFENIVSEILSCSHHVLTSSVRDQIEYRHTAK